MRNLAYSFQYYLNLSRGREEERVDRRGRSKERREREVKQGRKERRGRRKLDLGYGPLKIWILDTPLDKRRGKMTVVRRRQLKKVITFRGDDKKVVRFLKKNTVTPISCWNPLPIRLEGLGSVVSSPAESGAEHRSKTMLVHLKHHRMLLVALLEVR